MEDIKKGLSEKMDIGEVEGKLGMKRESPNQIPKGPKAEKSSKGGKSFKIT